MAIGDGNSSTAIEQDPSIAQIQAQNLVAQQFLAQLPSNGFVASLNALSGILNISQGANIQISSDGVSTLTIAVTGITAPAMAKSNVAASAPGPSNDEFEGYNYFSEWIVDVAPREFWVCLNPASGAADWQKLN